MKLELLKGLDISKMLINRTLSRKNGRNIHTSAQFKRDFVRLTDSKRVLMKTSKAYEKISDCLHVSFR